MDDKFSKILEQTPQMLVERLKLKELAPDWLVDDDGIHRPDNKFFKMVGAGITSGGGLEVKSWKQPFIEEKGGEVTLATFDGQFLVRPKQEPGNPSYFNYALWAAGFQASEANKSMAHGGTKPLYANIEEIGNIISNSGQAKDGNRFLGKVNTLKVIELDEEPELTGGARLISEKDLARMICGKPGQISPANEHLVEAYARLKAAQVLGLV